MNNLPVSADDFVNALAKTTTKLGSDSGGMQYLRLHKGGFFVYGQDDVDTEDGSLWAVNPASFAIGYVCWPSEGTGKPLGEEMRGITQDPIEESQLPQRPGGLWQQQAQMNLMCVSGEDTGIEVVFKASSKGGINGFNDFLNQVMIHLKNNPGTEKVVPVIKLEVNSYKHQTYGKIYTPVFAIDSWTSMDSMPTPAAEDEPLLEPDPEPVVEPEPAAQTPTRRRRRKAA